MRGLVGTGIDQLTVALAGLLAVIALMTLVWVGSVIRRDVSLVDRFWGPAFIMLGTAYAFASPTYSSRSSLILTLVTIWGVRLAYHITKRNWGKGEDYRYVAMRGRGGPWFPLKSLVTIFWFQAFLAWVVGAPLLAVTTATQPMGLTILDGLGTVCWIIGFLFEVVGDMQLKRFKADPASKGKVMDRGLWRYTRHPNYFGEFVMAWSYWIIALAAGGWWSFVGPATISVLLLRVSGVTLVEKKLTSSREGYAEYVARTSAFFPRPPKKTPRG